MDVTNPYEFRWCGDIHGAKPYKIIGFRWAFISQTPVGLLRVRPEARDAKHSGRLPPGPPFKKARPWTAQDLAEE